MAYANRAPKGVTVTMALVFTLLGVLGTFVGLFPSTIGVLAYAISSVILLLGVFLRKL